MVEKNAKPPGGKRQTTRRLNGREDDLEAGWRSWTPTSPPPPHN